MKTKINLKKGVLLFAVISMLIGCGIAVIPTLITKDITLAKVTITGLQNFSSYTQVTTVDLTAATDDIESITKAKIKSFSLKIGDDYSDIATSSREVTIAFVVAVVQGLPDVLNLTIGNTTFKPNSGDQADIKIPGHWSGFSSGVTGFATFDSANPEYLKFEFDEPFEMKDYIVDGKLKLNIAIAEAQLINFNDASFTFDLKVETEVEVEL